MGEADSEEAMAEFASDTGLLADAGETVALSYFDYEAYARDLFDLHLY